MMTDTGWIDAIMALNARIVTAEAHFNREVIDLVSMVERAEDTTNAEQSLSSRADSLDLLRAVQAQLLTDTKVDG